MQTLHDVVDALPRLGNRRALGLRGKHGTRWTTYNELHTMVHRAANVLTAAGLTRGQRILLHAPNSPEWVAFFLGAALCGVVVVPVDAAEPAARVLEIARLTEAVFLIDERKDPLIGIPRHDIHDLEAQAENHQRANIAPDDPAVILFTSGSTGAARGVILTHRNLLQQVAPFLRFRTPLRLLRFRLLALSPLSHVQGLILGLCIPLSIGLIVLYTHDVRPAHLIRTIRSSRIRFLSTVPRVLDLLERELRERIGPRGNPWKLARILGRRFRVVLVGGATLPRERETFWRQSAVAVVQGYGMTETSALATINIPFLGRAGSIGRELHRTSIRIAEDGEILVRGPHVANAFLGDDAGAFTDDGYLRTGDLASRDPKNRLFFRGRKKDVLVTAEGHNVHPVTVESRLMAQDGVRDAVVIGFPRDGFDELHAVLLLDRGTDAAKAVQSANLDLAAHERIRSWTVWPDRDFPRGVLGKAQRGEIAQRIADATDSPLTRPTATLSPQAGRGATEHALSVSPRPSPLPSPLTRPTATLSPQAGRGATERGPGTAIQLKERRPSVAPLPAHWRGEGGPDAERSVAEGPGEGPREARSHETALDAAALDPDPIRRVQRLGSYFAERPTEATNAAERMRYLGVDSIDALQVLSHLETEPGGPRTKPDLQSPSWPFAPGLGGARWMLRRALLDPFLTMHTRTSGSEHLQSIDGPCLFALTGEQRLDRLDFLRVDRALPARFRRRLMFVMASAPAFQTYVAPRDEPRWYRLWVAFLFRIGVPLFMPFTLFPTPTETGTAEGLRRACMWADRGFVPLTTWGRGTAILAAECQLPVVPVRMHIDEKAVTIAFQTPILPQPARSSDELHALVSRS